jgi:hypothetical protein
MCPTYTGRVKADVVVNAFLLGVVARLWKDEVQLSTPFFASFGAKKLGPASG